MSVQSRVSERPKDQLFEKFSPVDGSSQGEYPISTKEEVEEAVSRARKAFPEWRDMGLEKRLSYLDEVHSTIRRHGERYAQVISEDTGKPLVDSLLTELMSIPLFIDYYRKEAPKALKRRRLRPQVLFPGKASYVEYAPKGVIGIISPWNFPFQLSVIPVISALIGGNTVVLKPSEVTPLTGELIRELFQEAGFPKGVLEVVQGDGSTGAALTASDIDMIFFTGSVQTGRKVMEAASKKPIPVELELGGKDAMIVLEDANLERAARGAVWGGFINCGQMCISVERLFVVDEVYDEFVKKVKREVENLRVGAPGDGSDLGPLTFKGQIDVVKAHLEDALAKGATIAVGGKEKEGPGQFFEPTLILDVNTEMEIYKEETFGPVLPVIRVRDGEEALQKTNDHKYGLTASVWTGDKKRGMEMASRIEAGQVSINDLVQSVGNPALPFGGVKKSGFGRYHGHEGLYSFMNQKAIMATPDLLDVEPFWFPYASKYPKILDTFEKLLDGKIVRVAKNFWDLIQKTKKREGRS